MRIHLIRASGEQEMIDGNYSAIRGLIGAESLDSVNLRDGRTMLVDDLGHSKRKPLNAEATRLYHGVCRPGTTHQIVGDVAVIYSGSGDR